MTETVQVAAAGAKWCGAHLREFRWQGELAATPSSCVRCPRRTP